MTAEASKAYQLADYIHGSFFDEAHALDHGDVVNSGVVTRVGSTSSRSSQRIEVFGMVGDREAWQTLAKDVNGHYHLSTTFVEEGGEHVQFHLSPTAPDRHQEVVWDSLFCQRLVGILAQRSVQEDEEQPKVSLGDFLRERRAELKKPQRQMGMPSGQISQIESGVIPRVNPFTLLGLAESYEFSLSDLENSVAIDEELIASARTVLIGQAVMGLPDSELESIVESLGIGHIY